jgi:hypothetical protein
MKRPSFTRWTWWTRHDINMLDLAVVVVVLTITHDMALLPAWSVAAGAGFAWGLVCRYVLKIERPR